MRSVPLKNYIICFVIIVLTVLLSFYIRDWYITTKEYYAENSPVKEVISEIKEDEISNYILENPKFAIYVSSEKNVSIKDFEGDFRDIIKKLEIQNNLLYLNSDDVNVENFISDMKRNFGGKVNKFSSSSEATLYVFENGKIVSVINDLNNYSSKNLKKLLERFEL